MIVVCVIISVGSDAIMQAIACDKKIGWRAEARRFLVFATDTNFHSAEEMKVFFFSNITNM